MFDLTDKTALVTGATGGIGAAVATTLHAQGATVALSGRNEEKLAALQSALGERVHVLPTDLSDLEACDALPGRAQEAMGSLSILVANAGITRDQLMMRMKPHEFDEVLSVNLTATWRLAKACLKGMMKARHGRIIGITSVVGVTGNAGQTNYAASKAGMIGMMKSLAG
ncbi:MAG: SDR family NAD(P)-dependent oxidoreductase, partial [Pseudomonadota bacterium]